MIIAVSTRHIFALLSYIKCPYCSTVIFIFFSKSTYCAKKPHIFAQMSCSQRRDPAASRHIREKRLDGAWQKLYDAIRYNLLLFFGVRSPDAKQIEESFSCRKQNTQPTIVIRPNGSKSENRCPSAPSLSPFSRSSARFLISYGTASAALDRVSVPCAENIRQGISRNLTGGSYSFSS